MSKKNLDEERKRKQEEQDRFDLGTYPWDEDDEKVSHDEDEYEEDWSRG